MSEMLLSWTGMSGCYEMVHLGWNSVEWYQEGRWWYLE